MVNARRGQRSQRVGPSENMTHNNAEGNEVIQVLVVERAREDTSRMAQFLGEMRDHGIALSVVDTVEEALGAVAAQRHAAVLLQLNLPGVSVTEVLLEMKKLSPDVPVVVFTDRDEEDTGKAAIQCGAADYLVTDSLTGWFLARVLRHVIEKARLETKLKESEDRRRALFEHTGTAMMLVGEDGVIRQLNEPAETLLGCARSEVEGRTSWKAFFAPGAEWMEGVARQASPFTPIVIETHLVRCSGETRGALVNIVGVSGSKDLIVRLSDMSANELIESEMRRQREFFRSLFHNAPEGIVVFDANALVVDVNPAFEQLFRFQREGIVGRDIIDSIVPPRLRPGARQVLREGLEAGTLVPETMRRRADGSEVPVSILGAPVIVDGEHVGGFGIYRDVSAQRQAKERLEEAFIDLVETITRAIESVDPYTAMHQRRVARLADLVGRHLGLDEDGLQGLYVGSMLHDIGKLSLPSTILTKPGKLTPQEWALIRSHPRRGYDVLLDAKLPWPVADMALRHHERIDGSGYPDRVAGESLSLELRILGVCDVVEAMTSDRPYRPALSVEAVLGELREGAGTRYDDGVVRAVMEVVDSREFLLNAGHKNEF